MICQTCHGNGFITPPAPRHPDTYYPCPTCQGSGIDHCCDGDQPNPRDEAIAGDFDWLREEVAAEVKRLAEDCCDGDQPNPRDDNLSHVADFISSPDPILEMLRKRGMVEGEPEQ